MHADPKKAQKDSRQVISVFFALLGFASANAACKLLMKLSDTCLPQWLASTLQVSS